MNALSRLAVLVAAFLLAAGVLETRLEASPQGGGIRHAMAPTAGGSAYVADPGSGHLLVLSAEGRARALGRLPEGLPVALAAGPGGLLVLGTDRGAAYSDDGGMSWRPAALPAGPYPVAMVEGDAALLGRWTGSMYLSRDRGTTWRPLAVTGNWTAIAKAPGGVWAATLTGVLRSDDDGQTWADTGLPSRVTALQATSTGIRAVRWDGTSYDAAVSGPPRLGPQYPAGVWALSGGLVATVSGLSDDRGPLPALGGREVTALVGSESAFFAGIAHGPVMVSRDRGASWKVALDR